MAYEPSDRSTSTYWARIALLEAVRKVKPEVLNDLREVLPLFRTAKLYLERRHSFAPDLLEWSIVKSKEPDASILSLRSAIATWAEKNNLKFDWAIKHAIYSLIHWDIDMSSFDYGWCYKGHSPSRLSEEERRFVFELDEGWHTDHEAQKVFTKRANQAFRQHLQTYLDRIKVLLQERQHVETKRKYKPLVVGYDDFKLLAMRLVQKLSNSQITDILENAQQELEAGSDSETSVNEETIRIRVLRTAKLCGIDMKTLARGHRTENGK